VTVGTVVASVLVALIAGLFGYTGARWGRRKEKVDAAATVTKTALSLIDPLNIEIAKLTSRVAVLERDKTDLVTRVAILEVDNRNLRSENTGLRTRVSSLESQILALGHTPVNGQPATTTTTTSVETSVVTHEGDAA
jgi:FtsZ-binding cell division protein ZapB